VLGSGSLIDDLEKGLVGVKGGETRHITATFPAITAINRSPARRWSFRLSIRSRRAGIGRK